MAGKNLSGNYCSQAVLTTTESSAGTLTFQKIETGLSVYDKIGWVINKIKWFLGTSTLQQFNGTNDLLTMALTMSNQLTALAQNNPAIVAAKWLQRTDLGTAASGDFHQLDIEDDFSTLPGGGLLILPNPIYLAVIGTSLAAAVTVTARLFYQAIELTDADFTNLVQARQLLISS